MNSVAGTFASERRWSSAWEWWKGVDLQESEGEGRVETANFMHQRLCDVFLFGFWTPPPVTRRMALDDTWSVGVRFPVWLLFCASACGRFVPGPSHLISFPRIPSTR